MSGITVDISGAVAKTAVLLQMPKATKAQLTDFGSDTVKALKESARTSLKTKSGALWRSIGQKVFAAGDYLQLVVGTGVSGATGNMLAQKYASIQDRGGTTHPRVTPKMRRWAWAMHYGGFAGEVRGMGLRGAERKGALATWGGINVYKAIALTKKDRLTVNIPASRWFSDVWEFRISLLNQRYLNDKAIMERAKQMSGGTYAS